MAQTTYEQISDRALPLGSLFSGSLKDALSACNNSPAAAQQDTVTITNYVALKQLDWTIDGVAFSYVMTVADADTTGVAASIRDQLQAEPIFGGRFYCTSAMGVITITARFAGVGWTLLSTGTWTADFTVANVTANAAGAVLPFGCLAINDGFETGTLNRLAKLAAAASMTAQVVVGTPSHEDLTIFTLDITCKGITYHSQYDSTAGHTVANICLALMNAVNAIMPATTVVATGGVTEVTLTAELAGQGFTAVFGTSLAPATWTVTDTALETDDVNECALGVVLRSDDVETVSDTAPAYAAQSTCSILRSGDIVVQTPTLIVASRGVWVRVAAAVAGSPIGSFRDTAAANCIELDRRRFRWVAGQNATRAILHVAAD